MRIYKNYGYVLYIIHNRYKRKNIFLFSNVFCLDLLPQCNLWVIVNKPIWFVKC